MIIPRKEEALHKAKMIALLTAIIDDPTLSKYLKFKGGTCAAMLGFLDRFSGDLDFDMEKGAPKAKIRKAFYEIFDRLGFRIKNESKNTPQFFLGYDNPRDNHRNSLKIDVTDLAPKTNVYETHNLIDISRVFVCQTKETMFANKLIALTDRHEKRSKIAGRDVYDIHHFFVMGYDYNEKVIEERTGEDLVKFFKKLKAFVEKYIDKQKLEQDLNTLLTPENFKRSISTLKIETLVFLGDEIKRLENKRER